jgi:L,D-transpeptidase catalytic domain
LSRLTAVAREILFGGNVQIRALLGAAAFGMACAAFTDAADANAVRRSDDMFVAREHVVTHVKRRGPGRKNSKAAEKAKKDPFGAMPKGPLHIVISIDRQRLSLYSNGVHVADAPVSTGMPGYPTPTGVFSVIQKARFHRSNLYFDAPMPFMQRLTWSGVALHAGALPGYPASHGCVRLPSDFAQRLFAVTRLGARVIVARDAVSPVEFEHARLFVRKERPPELLPVVELPADAASEGGPVKIAEAAAIGMATDAVEGAAPVTSTAAATERVLRAAGVTAARAAAKAPEADAASWMTATHARGDALVTGELRPAIDAVETSAPAEPNASDPPKPDVVRPPEPPRRTGPVAVYISRKDRKVYVRQGFEPLFDAPVTISDPDTPFGTHVFTAMEFKDDGARLRWTAVSMPAEPNVRQTQPPRGARKIADVLRERGHARMKAPPPSPGPQSASAVLDRVELPQAAIDRISELMSPGSSLVVSDHGLGSETGRGTDFIVVTR